MSMCCAEGRHSQGGWFPPPRTTKNTHSRTCSTPASVSGSSPVREGLVPRGPRLNARGSLPRRYEKLDQGGGPAWLGVLRNYLPISMLTP